jgi:hypothetical protein
MTIPTISKDQPDSGAPRAGDNRLQPNSVKANAIWSGLPVPRSKKDKHLPPFWALWPFCDRLRQGVAFRQHF